MLIDRIIKLVELDPRAHTQTHLFGALRGRVERREGPDKDFVTLPADRVELVYGRPCFLQLENYSVCLRNCEKANDCSRQGLRVGLRAQK